jgi:hypothetical protein
MNAHAKKTSPSESQFLPNPGQKNRNSDHSLLTLVDNREESVMQRKLQGMANKGLQTVQPKFKVFQEMVTHSSNEPQVFQMQASSEFGEMNQNLNSINKDPIQLYQYKKGNTMNITLNSGTTNNSKTFEICTGNQVSYDKGDQRRMGTGTGKADWQGWLIDTGTSNNATQLHVVNQEWGGLGGTADGNIGPGSQQLNGYHKGPEAKYKNLFDKNGIAKYDMTYDCIFDYNKGDGLLNHNNSTISNDVVISDPVIYCDITADNKNGENFGEGWVVPGSNAAGMKIRNGG